MPDEPPAKRAVAFVDGQNLFHAAREAFGYTYPNYAVRALAERVREQTACRQSHDEVHGAGKRAIRPLGILAEAAQ